MGRTVSRRSPAPNPSARRRSKSPAHPEAPLRFAAIDNGSNAIRLKIVEATSPTVRKVLVAKRFPVRLGREVFQTGRLAPRAIAQALEVYRTAQRLLGRYQVPPQRLRAVATSAVRNAENGNELVEQVKRDTGIELETISGAQEASLVLLALRRTLDLAKRRALIFDLGGGSLETSVVVEGESRFFAGLEIGTVRLLEAFLRPRRSVGRAEELVLLEYIDRNLLPILPQVRKLAPNLSVGVGGNLETLAELCPAPADDGPGIHCAGLDGLLDKLTSLSPAERRDQFQLRPDRADVIVPATYIVRRLAQVFDIRRIAVPGVGLREGLLERVVEKGFGVWDYAEEATGFATAARALARRYDFDEAHAEQTERLALRLFDELQALHGLGPGERELLRLAAILHDVGVFVSFDRHHKHSHYLILNSDLGGLSQDRRELVALIARFHRKRLPTARHPLLAAVPRRKRDIVIKLASLLRVADALDREHRRSVIDISVRTTGQLVSLGVRASGDTALELWTVRQKADLFEKTFERRLVVELE